MPINPPESETGAIRPLRDSILTGAVVFTVAAAALFFVYLQAEAALLNQKREHLGQIAKAAAATLDPALHARITTTGDNDYKAACEPLLKIRRAVPELYYAYTVVPSPEGPKFVLDSSYFLKNVGDETEEAAFGEVYADAPEALLEAIHLRRTTVSKKPYTDKWGTFLSGFAPFFAPDGSVVGFVGVDISLTDLERHLSPFRMTLLLAVVGSAVGAGAVAFGRYRSLTVLCQANVQSVQALQFSEKAALAAQQANDAKSSFLATISHEIRTPLNGVIGMTRVLQSTPLDEDQQECVHSIRVSGEALISVINDILDFSRIEAGRLELASQPWSPAACVAEVIEMTALSASRKGLELVHQVDPDVPARILGDVNRVRQVLLNLVDNAIKFTAAGKVVVAVRPKLSSKPIAQVEFSVSDSGIGIPTDQIAGLFTPFSQVDSSTTRLTGGTGLGLAICKRLVDLMGGKIELETVEGSGSTFRFTVDALALPGPAGEVGAISGVDGDFAKRHPLDILVAEDNELNRRVVQLLLGRLGYEHIRFAVNGAEAVQATAERAPDVILMDLHMPVLDGLEATARIRQSAVIRSTGRHSKPWIIALTADVLATNKDVALKAGMDDYLSKPVQLETLAAMIAKAHAAIHSST